MVGLKKTFSHYIEGVLSFGTIYEQGAFYLQKTVEVWKRNVINVPWRLLLPSPANSLNSFSTGFEESSQYSIPSMLLGSGSGQLPTLFVDTKRTSWWARRS